ncbi:transposase [Dictyobacter aurantiacus]|uniref:Transposase n=1 Tax=Dictyobacter aurantiacus TaxID=1936993 RepID=A0A401Z9G1_9CHLR|nr:transposase [Dictyobacter aurantiacus]GCE03436.1 hypothetical protein KDAU_07650 [Dictyobacter aurantiacus]
MHNHQHSPEFTLDVVRQVASRDKRPAQVCREHGLAESVLSRWRKEYQEHGERSLVNVEAVRDVGQFLIGGREATEAQMRQGVERAL